MEGIEKAPPPRHPDTRKERRQARKRHHKLISQIFECKLAAINERRHALSFTTIFYFLALHKLEHAIISSLPLVVRQSVYILFVHHIVNHGTQIKLLISDKTGDHARKQGPVWRRTHEWMQSTCRSLAEALDLQSDDRFTTSVIRHLEDLVELSVQAKTNLTGRQPRHLNKADSKLENVVLNPMFAKRVLLNYSNSFKTKILETMHEADLSAKRPTAPETSQTGAPPADKGPISSFMPLPSFKKLSTFNFAAPNVPRKLDLNETSDSWSLYMPMDRLLEIQEVAVRPNGPMMLVIEDIAERMEHLPNLTVDLLANARSMDVTGMFRNVLQKTDEQHTDNSSQTESAPPDSCDDRDDEDEELDTPATIDLDNCVQIAIMDEATEIIDVLPLSTSHSISNVNRGEDSSASNVVPFEHREDVCQAVTLPVILIWSVMFRLLCEGIWNSGVEYVCKETAKSLDIEDQFTLMLLSYAADVVCDAVHAESIDGAGDVMIDSITGEAITVNTLAHVDSSRLKKLAKKHRNQNVMKGLKIAGMSVGVGALSALTAGLAAPAFAAGFGALGIAGTSGLTAFLGSAGGAASLASLFGASSASLSGWKYSRRLADIRVCEFVKLDSDTSNHSMDAIGGYIHELIEYKQRAIQITSEHRFSGSRERYRAMTSLSRVSNPCLMNRPLGLHHLKPDYSSGCKRVEPPFRLTIGVSGWLKDAKDKNGRDATTAGWQFLRDCLGTESYAFQWEPQLLHDLGFMMMRLLGENVAYQAATLSIQIAVSASAGFIMWPVSFIQYAAQLDNAWLTAKERAQQAGVILAAAICDKSIVGNRPVTLIGCSMGSRVITYCLKELYRRQEMFRVSDVILVGLPDGKNKDDWRKMRAVVTGRLINVYNSSDFILIFLYRWMEWGVSVAGLSPIEGVEGVENCDVSAIIQSHYEYEDKLPDILSLLKMHSSLVKYIT